MNPYATSAAAYLAAGFSPVPLPYGRKAAPAPGWTGAGGKWADEATVRRWSGAGRRNICVRLPEGVLGIDVDAYAGKAGAATLEALERELGPLPPTWVSTSRRDDPVSGIRLYRVPEGREWKDAGPGVETIRHSHRYAVVAPSRHPEGRVYGWRGPDGGWAGEWNGTKVDDLPLLPETWVQRLMKPQVVSAAGGSGGGDERHPYATRVIEKELQRLDDLDLLGWAGAGWDNTCFEVACNLIEFGNAEWSGWSVGELQDLFFEHCPVDAEFGPEQHGAKWGSAVRRVAGGARSAPVALSFDPVVPGETTVEKEYYDPHDVTHDANLGQRLARDYLRGRFLAWGKGRWAKWDGQRWDLNVPEDEVIGFARNALLEILAFETGKLSEETANKIRKARAENDQQTIDLASESEDQRRKALKRLKSLGVILAALKIARGLLVVRLEDFDGDRTRWYLNCGNGVVDLRTGELGEWDRELLFTRVTPVEYQEGARHPDWDKALRAVPEDVLEWLQKRIGQAATGFIPPDDIVPFWYGSGSNGKSSILTGLRRALGPFFTTVPDKVLTGSASDHSTEFMPLKGARLAIIEELPGGDWLEDTRLKKVVGSESGITARGIGQDNVTWEPTHSLMVTTNHEIRVSDMTHGTWRRLARVVFPHKFGGEDGEEGDGTLRERLATGVDGRAEAVLAWVVDGAVRAAQEGLSVVDVPERVRADTLEWKLGGDPVVAFFREVLEPAGVRVAVETPLLYAMYREWVTARGNKPVADRELWTRFGQVSRDIGLGGAEKTRIRRGGTWEVVGPGASDIVNVVAGARLTTLGVELAREML